MFHRFSAPLFAALAAGALHAQETEQPSFEPKPLAGYQALWTRSLFTTHEVKPNVPTVENADWAANLQLSGWSEVDGQLYVYLYRTDTTQTFIVKQNEPAEAGVMQVVEMENAESIVDARVRVQLNGQGAWIAQQKESEVPQPPQSSPQQPAAQQAVAGVQAPTSVDSRAALLRPGVVLDAGATFENSLAKPGTTPSAMESTTAAQTRNSEDESRSNAAVLLRLRERHEHLYRMFPRQGGP
ncbi:hypothetical protein [Prosthecobacter vanneervenii]|uniref:Uncharacterized protein n=1 Tax=Prosthecobacter vanneervenii TaxID=48466 RepID=A0A7W7Y8H7_9BACT|nr:hypothetical protein [Prosthecobacter vanneervenii]MBB5031556.1 hypothetical protein [Prosthecobacter vanneervenii]